MVFCEILETSITQSSSSMLKRSSKLNGVCYDIRGPVLTEALRMEEAGYNILKLNIGNPAPFGFEAPADIIKDVIQQLPSSQGYGESQGSYSARVAVQQYYQTLNVNNVPPEQIFLGNGVSELIMMSMQGLLEQGDEVLVPAPDYPLWTAAVKLSGGEPIHYRSDEANEWQPDLADIEAKITPNTRALVIINPNNPTGAVYSKAMLKSLIAIAKKHQLLIFSDEIYDKILYDEQRHIALASLTDELVITFSGLSKNYRVAGFRVGWMILSGNVTSAQDYIAGLNMLASMRLCSNVPMQNAIQTALGGFQSIYELTRAGGRLYEQMNFASERLNSIPGISCVRPKGAMYLFPKIDIERFNITDDEQFVLDFLKAEKILLVHGRAFNWPDPDHFRIVFLPHRETLEAALDALERFLSTYRQA
ncbi:MAG: pyridoxal phosphate-dependent aminotransferase [Enterobacterales bacterium]|nr:pyridoxal phosphate-dependent aminotransferase [Enterobacterales bacterium]